MATVLADIGKDPNERARKKTVATAVRLVASELGNTAAICRKSYVHPVLITRYLKNGSTIVVDHSRRRSEPPSRFGHSAEETALIKFLDEYFPERRKERRTE